VAGAAAGCAVGHHEVNKKAKQNAAQNQPASNTEQPNSGNGPDTWH
jgi:hypothetical protein